MIPCAQLQEIAEALEACEKSILRFPGSLHDKALLKIQKISPIIRTALATPASPSEGAEAYAKLLEEMMDRRPKDQSWRMALAIGARTIRRGRHLTAVEELANLKAAMDEADDKATPFPPTSDWDAGATEMREGCAYFIRHYAKAPETVAELADRILALPLPWRPA